MELFPDKEGKESSPAASITLVFGSAAQALPPVVPQPLPSKEQRLTDAEQQGHTAENLPWHAMGFGGLETFFDNANAVQIADKKTAELRAMLDGCSKVELAVADQTLAPEGRAFGKVIRVSNIADTGALRVASNAMGAIGRFASRQGERAIAFASFYGNEIADMKRAPLLGKVGQINAEYGVPKAMTLYLRFQIQASIFTFMVFLLSLPHVVDSYSRNTLRNECRADLLAGGNASACGYDRYAVRASREIPLVPDGFANIVDLAANGQSMWGLGACEEYSNLTNYSLPFPGLGVQLFVETPSEPTCGGGLASIAYWCDFLITLAVLGGIYFLRYQARAEALADDHARWTTGDYAVMLRNLDDGLDESQPEGERRDADSLRSALEADLEHLGLGGAKVKQIEVGRKCRREIRLLRRLDLLNTRYHELAARCCHRMCHAKSSKADGATRPEEGAPALPDAEGNVDAKAVLQHYTAEELAASYVITDQMEILVSEMSELWRERDYATGHAYIIFQYETDRNRLLNILNSVPGPKRKSLLVDLYEGWRPAEWEHTKAMLPRSANVRYRMGVEAVPAPEPSEVVWQNLELDDKHESRQLRLGLAIITFIVVVGVAVTLVVRQNKVENQEKPFVDPNEDFVLSNFITFLLTVGSSVTIAGFNGLLKVTSLILTQREGQDSQTEYEASFFAKISVAYVVNSAAIPLLIGAIFSWFVSGRMIDQSWYESGGVLSQAWLLMLINAFAKDMLKVIQPLPRLMRLMITARSQKKLNRVTRPPPMRIGDFYASTLKTVALAYAYGPIYPFAYLWSSFAFIICWFCTRYGISVWFRKPPAVNETMMIKFCSGVTGVMALHLVVQAAGCYAQGTSFVDGIAVYVFAPLAWLAWVCAPLHRCSESFRPLTLDNLSEDTDGIAYDDVRRLKNTELERYICPKLSASLLEAATSMLTNLKGEQEHLLNIHGEHVLNAALKKARVRNGNGRDSAASGGSMADWLSNLLDS